MTDQVLHNVIAKGRHRHISRPQAATIRMSEWLTCIMAPPVFFFNYFSNPYTLDNILRLPKPHKVIRQQHHSPLHSSPDERNLHPLDLSLNKKNLMNFFKWFLRGHLGAPYTLHHATGHLRNQTGTFFLNFFSIPPMLSKKWFQNKRPSGGPWPRKCGPRGRKHIWADSWD